MKNKLSCPACGFENNFYSRICSSCKSYLRDRVVNIDLWSIITTLVENPLKAFRTIIFAEHKNFIFFLVLIAAIKYFITARFLSGYTIGEFISTSNIFISFFIVLSAVTLFFLLSAFLIKIFWNNLGFNSRFKDNLAVIIYSQVPIIFALLLLFPLEIVVFGNFLFSTNPSPFQIKSTISYIFFIVEVIVFLWSVFLYFAAFYASSNNKVLSILTTVVFVFLLSAILIFLSRIIFTL
jgi:hypothetical protein